MAPSARYPGSHWSSRGRAAANLWMGVSRAGYSVSEEFPIFLLIFAVPAVAGLFAAWRVS